MQQDKDINIRIQNFVEQLEPRGGKAHSGKQNKNAAQNVEFIWTQLYQAGKIKQDDTPAGKDKKVQQIDQIKNALLNEQAMKNFDYSSITQLPDFVAYMGEVQSEQKAKEREIEEVKQPFKEAISTLKQQINKVEADRKQLDKNYKSKLQQQLKQINKLQKEISNPNYIKKEEKLKRAHNLQILKKILDYDKMRDQYKLDKDALIDKLSDLNEREIEREKKQQEINRKADEEAKQPRKPRASDFLIQKQTKPMKSLFKTRQIQ